MGKKVQVMFPKPSRTKQALEPQYNISKLMKRFKETGDWFGTFGHNIKNPVSGDFTSRLDFTDAMNLVTSAQSAFEALPSTPLYRDWETDRKSVV